MWIVFMTPANYYCNRHRVERDAANFLLDSVRSGRRMMAGVAIFWLGRFWGALMRTTGMAGPTGFRRRILGIRVQRTGHSALRVDDRGRHRGKR
jgi:hypothetical protein